MALPPLIACLPQPYHLFIRKDLAFRQVSKTHFSKTSTSMKVFIPVTYIAILSFFGFHTLRAARDGYIAAAWLRRMHRSFSKIY